MAFITLPFVQRLIAVCLVYILCTPQHVYALEDDLQNVVDGQTGGEDIQRLPFSTQELTSILSDL